MTAEWTEMVDALSQLREALEGLDAGSEYTVLTRWPRREDTGTLITITELTNTQTDVSVVDQLGYQIDIWSDDRDAVRELVPLVNAALCGIGLKREYAGEEWREPKYYRRTLRYGRRVDKRTLRLID